MNEKLIKTLEFDKIIEKLASCTVSPMGKEMAEALCPKTEYEEVELLLKETSDGVSFLYRMGNPPLAGIRDIRASIARVEIGGMLDPGELLDIAGVLQACGRLKKYAENADQDGENAIASLIQGLESHVRIQDKIRSVVVSEDEIADDASPVLSSIRRQIKREQETIRERLNDLIRSSKYQKYIQDPVVTIRADRYVIPVKQEYRNEMPGIVHDASASGATVFIEPMAVVEANNNIKQLKIKEQAEIERLLKELTSEVEGILQSLKSNMVLLAKLDFIFAKAKLSLDYGCVCPRLNRQMRIVIKKGRHPLLDKNTVVPIDFWIGEKFNTLVITGPNTGGKTVTLKTVGLLTLMAQAGLHVPAGEGTLMNVFGKVFADIGDEQSIEQSLSTFSSHMKNIVQIFENVDNNSLVLLDELGAGTDPTEGAALAIAILERLYQIGATTIATTHYSELKMYALSNSGVENACCEFDIATLMPTYNLLIGVPGKSNAFAISKRLGLPNLILERAMEFLTKEDIKFEDVLMSIEKSRKEYENQRILAEKYRIEIENLKKDLEEKTAKINAQREKLIREAKEEARKILFDAKREARDIIDEMKRISAHNESAERDKAVDKLRARLKENLDKVDSSLTDAGVNIEEFVNPPENLKPGDSVLIVNLNQKGTVKAPPDREGKAVVQAGIMEISVHISNLRLIDEQKGEIQKTGLGKIGVSKSVSISTEIDIRGLTVEEASGGIDKYLDDASIAGLKEVTIIHGKGTGALRSGIHRFLKTHPHVKSFRLGKYGEGETGVTVVELK